MDEKDLVTLARETIMAHFGGAVDAGPYEEAFPEKQGAFVTLKTFPDDKLRGCIGYVLPVFPLAETVQRAAVSAAFEDTRFSPLQKDEQFVVEVSVLTVPQPLSCPPEERAENIRIGVDGIIVEYRGCQGLLLPQVATEHNLSAKEFLYHLALKAGIGPEDVYSPEAVISTFQAKIYGEDAPNGEIIEKT